MKKKIPECGSLFYFNALPCLLYDQDTFEILEVNEVAINQFGYEKEKFLLLHFTDLLSSEELNRLNIAHQGIQNLEGNISLGTFSFQNHSGEIVQLDINGFNLEFQNRKCLIVTCQSPSPALRQNLEAIRLVNSSLDVFCTINNENEFSYVSAASLEHWGYSPEELIGTSYLDLVVEEDIPETVELAESLMKGKITRTFINRYKKKNGGFAYNFWSVKYDDSSKLFNCVARVASEKLELDAKIQLSEQRFKALVQDGSDLIAIVDLDGIYKYVSPTSISVLGIDPEDFIGKSAFDFIHPDDAEIIIAGLEKTLTESRVRTSTFRFYNHKKEWRWLETVLTNMLENPSVKGIVANSRDVTDKIEQEEKIEKSQKRFESLVENSMDCVIIISPEAKTTYVSGSVKNILGYNRDEVMGIDIRTLIHPEDLAGSEDAIVGTLQNPGIPMQGFTARIKHKNGTWRWVEPVITNLIHDPAVRGIVDNFRDVTKQKNKEFEQDLVNSISTIFNNSIDYDLRKCLVKVSELITNFGSYDFIEMYLPDSDAKSINRISTYAASIDGQIFTNTLYNSISGPLGDGMPKHIWKNKKTEIWGNVEKKWIPERQFAASQAGIEAMMGVPFKHNNEVIGVMLLGTKNSKSHLTQYLELFENLETTIGSELSRKKIEIELAQIFDFSPDMICVAGFDGYIKKMNPAGIELLGYTLEEIQSKPIISFLYDKDKSLTKENQKKLYSGERLNNFENRYITKNGEIIWLNWTAHSSPENGIVYAVAKNVTEEKKLRELNKQANILARIGSWEMDLTNENEDNMYWSPVLKEILEVAEDYQPKFSQCLEMYTGESKNRVHLVMNRLINEGIEFDEELLIRTGKGKGNWIRCIGKRELWNNKPSKIYGSFQDINERKLFEVRLAESENRFKAILKAEPECIKLLGPDGAVLMMNPAGLAMIEADNEDQIKGKSVLNIVLPEHRPAFSQLTDQVFKGESGKLIFKIKGLKGTQRWLETHVVPLKNDQGEISSLLGITRDITENKQTEEAKNRLQETLENSLNEIYIFDSENFQFSYVNKGAIQNLGYSEQELNALTPLDIKPEFTYETFKKLITPLVTKEKEKIIFFTEHERKDGSLYPVEVHLQYVAEEHSTSFLAIILDITNRKNAEEATIKILKEKNIILESIDDGFFAVNNEGIVTYWNNQAEILLGRKKEQIIGKHLREEFADVIGTEFKEQFNKAIESGKAINFEAFYTNFNLWIEASFYPSSEGMSIYFKDITLRKEADAQLLKANERFEKVTEATNDAIWDWDIVNHTFQRSSAIERFFGKDSPTFLTGVDFWNENYHKDDKEKIQKSIQNAISNPTINHWELEYRVINEDEQKTIYVIDKGVIIRNEQGKAIRMVGSMTDVSELKEMDFELNKLNHSLQLYTAELERSNEDLEQFAFVASHDLQEPLRMISSFMDLLQRKYGDQLDQKAHRYIHFAMDGAIKMKRIILDLLEYSKANRPSEGSEEVNLNEILTDFKQLRRKLISEKTATILTSNLPVLHSYKAALTQIFHCLLDNAIKYSNPKTSPKIEISGIENEKEWQFSIKDNGIGIDGQFHEKIFVIFQRLQNKDENSGTGIGLSIAKRHVEFLGGKIWLESKSGVGSTFYFTIPKT